MHKIQSYSYYINRYISVGFPILLTSLSPILMAVADNAMVGYLSEEVRAASAFVNVITGTAFLLLMGISGVSMPLVAGAAVLKRYDKATRTLKYSVLVSMFCGMICVLFLLCLGPFLKYMGQDPEVIRHARKGYYQVIVASILVYSISQPLKRYLDGMGFRFINTGLSVLSALMNISMNYLLIGGRYGMPALGLFGAGIATFMSRFITLLICVVIVLVFRKKGYATAFFDEGWDQRYFTKMLKLGLPAGFEFAVKMLFLNTINVMIGWMGVIEQSAASIIFAFLRLGLMLPIAVGSAGSILLAEEWKQGNKEGIDRVRKTAYMLNISIMLVIGAVLYKLFPWMIGAIFNPAPAVNSLLGSLVGVTIVFQIVEGFNFMGTGLLRGIRDTFVPFLVTTAVSFFIGLPVSYYLGFSRGLGLLGMLQGVCITLFCAAISFYIRFSYKMRVLQARR